jgi:putative phosphoribosyl transferase
MWHLPFEDRFEARRSLGAELAARRFDSNPLVIALPRGGVLVADPVAEALAAPLDILVVRKLGIPWEPELAMGAIARGTWILDTALIRQLGISSREIIAAAAREMQEIERREALYREGRPAPEFHGRTVVLVDDGIATGSTMTAAARSVRSHDPRLLIIAAPVASDRAAENLRSEAEECVWLALPEPFRAVGEWYLDFHEVSDQDVQGVLRFRSPVAHA